MAWLLPDPFPAVWPLSPDSFSSVWTATEDCDSRLDVVDSSSMECVGVGGGLEEGRGGGGEGRGGERGGGGEGGITVESH